MRCLFLVDRSIDKQRCFVSKTTGGSFQPPPQQQPSSQQRPAHGIVLCFLLQHTNTTLRNTTRGESRAKGSIRDANPMWINKQILCGATSDVCFLFQQKWPTRHRHRRPLPSRRQHSRPRSHRCRRRPRSTTGASAYIHPSIDRSINLLISSHLKLLSFACETNPTHRSPWDPAPFLCRTASAPGALEFGSIDPPSLCLTIAAAALDRSPRASSSAVAAARAALAGDWAALAIVPRRPPPQQQVAAGRGKPPRSTPPPQPRPQQQQQQQQQQQFTPVPSPLPVLWRAEPPGWDADDVRRRYQELEGKCAALDAAVKQKDADVKVLMRKAEAEAAGREQAQVLAATLAERGRRLEEEYSEMTTTLERLQHRVRGLRANEQRLQAEVERLGRLNQARAKVSRRSC
jgi:uncharacterized protein YecA (UPF0149 family)